MIHKVLRNKVIVLKNKISFSSTRYTNSEDFKIKRPNYHVDIETFWPLLRSAWKKFILTKKIVGEDIEIIWNDLLESIDGTLC